MSENEWDTAFDLKFEDAMKRIDASVSGPLPDSDAAARASWKQLQQRLLREQRRAVWTRRIQWASYAAASLLAGAWLFHSLQTTEAFRPMFELVYKMKGGTVSVQYSTAEPPSRTGAKTAPPPDDDELPETALQDNRDLPEEGAYRRKQVSAAEAKAETQFVLPVPKDPPDGYSLQHVLLHYSAGASKAGAAKLVYRPTKGSAQPLTILVRKRAYSSHSGMPDGQRSWVPDAGGHGGELEWNVEDINVIIRGGLGEREQNELADSMQLAEE